MDRQRGRYSQQAAIQELNRRGLWGYVEPILTLGSAAFAEPVSGMMGLAALPYGADAATRAINRTQEALTYQPRTIEGQETLQAAGEFLQPVGDAFIGASEYLGDAAYDATGSPALGAVAYSVPTMALEALGLKGASKLSKGRAYEMGDISGYTKGLGGKQRGIFAGVKAKGADLDAMEAAKELQRRGVSRDEIWSKTGWFEDVDGAWKWEIDDSKYQFNLPEKAAGQQLTDAYQLINRLDDMSESDLLLEMELMDFKGTPAEYKAAEIKNAYDKLYDISKSDYPLEAAVDHPEMFGAYPSLKQVDARFRDSWRSKSGGSYSPDDDVIQLGSETSDKGSVMVHEIQHAIQEREGFAGGGSPSAFADDFAQNRARLAFLEKDETTKAILKEVDEAENAIVMRDDLDFEQMQKALFDLQAHYRQVSPHYKEYSKVLHALRGKSEDGIYEYKRLAGEAEARNVQTRLDFTPEQRRATPPWQTLDVPEDELIVRK